MKTLHTLILLLLFCFIAGSVPAITLDSGDITVEKTGNTVQVRLQFHNDSDEPFVGDLSLSFLNKEYKTETEVYKKLFILNGSHIEQVALPIPPGFDDWCLVRIDFMNQIWLKRPVAQVADQELHLIGQNQWIAGSNANLRVLVTQSVKQVPIENAIVKADLRSLHDSKTNIQIEALTDADGNAALRFPLPEEAIGEHQLTVTVTSNGKKDEVKTTVQVVPGSKIFLTTDKPVYQPNQLIHIRALAAHKQSGKPITDKDVTLEVYDGKGNKVFKQTHKTSGFGIVAADFQLADEVNQGAYAIKAILGDDTSEKSVQVYEYVLPKFKVTVKNEKDYYAPGDTVNGTVEARYFFGKAVAGAHVSVVANCFDVGFNEFDKAEGQTNAEGVFAYTLTVPERLVGQPAFKGNTVIQLDVRVLDTADHEEQKYHTFHAASDPLQIEVIPESGALVRGASNEVFLVASYPDGSVARPALTVSSPGMPDPQTVQCDDNGIASIFLTPGNGNQAEATELTITAADEGKQTTVTKSVPFNPEQETILLRPNKGIYRVGDNMRIEVFAATRTGGTVFVDIVKNNQTILTHTVRLDRENTITVPVDQSLAGTLALNGYIIRSDGNMIRDTRQVIVTRADDLHIDIQPNLDEYLPGQPASIKIAVTDPDGNPVQAALGMNIVDESVYSLAEKEPGLAKVFFAIEKELLDPKIEIHGFQMDKVVRLSAKKYQESNTLSKALLAKLDTLSEFGLNIDTAQQKVQKIQQDFNAIRNALSRTPFAYDGNPLTVEEMLVRLEVSLQDVPVLDPWNNPYMIFAENDQIQVASMGRDMELNTGDDIKREGVIYTRKAGSKSEGRDLFRGLNEKNFRFIGKGVKAIPELWFAQSQQLNESQQQNQHHLFFSYGRPVERRLGVRPMMMKNGAARGQEIALGAGVIELQEGMVMEDMAAVASVPVDALAMDGFGSVVVGDRFGLDEAESLSSLKLELDFDSDGLLSEAIEKYDLLSSDDGQPLLVDGELDQEALRNAVLDKLKDEIGDIALLQPNEEKPKQEKVRVRTYFPETLFYTPEFITDAKGEATLSLAMADSITTWRMTAMANAKSGAIGDTTSAMKVFKPFFIDLDLPVALIQSDEVTIPVAIYNYLPTAQTIDIQLEDKPWYTLLEGERERRVDVAANEVSSVTYRIKANELGKQPITVYAYGSEDSDAIGRHIDVRPNGDPRFVTHNGSLRQPVRADVDFPQDRVEGADKLFVKIYPGLFSQIVEGLDAILQMPYGCFEQTSSTTYPNVLALNYMRETGRVTPAIEMKALEYINLGYQRLLTFEIDGGGFQVFGNPPATRILSAYGLLEFSDMSAVYPIDPQVIERTQRWLIQQMRPDGSWAPDENYAHAEMWKSIQDNNLLVTAYIALALAKSGQQAGMDAPKNYLLQHAAEADDAYTLSILANALLAIAPDSDTTRKTLGKLVDMGVIEGDYLYWKSEASMSFARGNHANVETTAWAALALIESENYPQELGKALNWIIAQKDPNGTWGTTHGTVLALKALIKSLKSRTERSTATVTITVNGTEAQKIEITPDNSDIFRTIDVTQHAQDANRVELGFEGKGNLLYQVVGKYYTPWNAHIPRVAPFEIKVEYDRANLRRNDTVTCQVTAKNTTPNRAEMVMIDVGVPPGFRVEQPALDDYVKNGVIEKFTIMSRQVLIYLESMDGKQEIKLDIPMKATLPIVAKAPETSIYEYYNPEVKKIDQPQDIIVE